MTVQEIEHTEPQPDSANVSRRTMLRGVGATGAAFAATVVLRSPQTAQAQEPPPPFAMRRSPVLDIAGTSEPALPSPEIIALNRICFGPRPGDWSALQTMGSTPEARVRAFVEQQLSPASIPDADCDARLAAQGFATLGKSRTQLWVDHVAKDGIDWETRMQPANETIEATFLRAVYSKRQLVEVLADFWHNHFNVYGWDSWSAGTWVHYDRDVIRKNVFGNFRQMIGAVAQSPAMLYYLDNISNSAAGPNENYARESFELHAMGAENYMGVVSTVGPNGEYHHPAPLGADGKPSLYVDEDIYSATRCFTGWRVNRDTGAFTFEDSDHDKYQKIVLARTIPSGSGLQDGELVLDLLANHPGTARYVCRKLCRRLIGDTPPESVVIAAADVFYQQRNAANQLQQVVRTILLSNEFRSTWGQKIKRPFEFVVSMLRALNADYAWSDSFRWRYDGMGQPMFAWRPPNGYPDLKENWSSTMPMLQRWRMVNYLMNWWTYGGDGANKDDLRINCLKQTPANITTADALVNHWMYRVLNRAMPEVERGPIVDFMASGHNATGNLPPEDIEERLPHMVSMLLMSPSFQWR
jgi:uncharacterized protein (DUF1800 family)